MDRDPTGAGAPGARFVRCGPAAPDRRGSVMSEVVVVTGIGGMGIACARRLGPSRQLVVADFDEAKLAGEAERLAADGFAVTPHRVDVSDRDSVQRLAEVA